MKLHRRGVVGVVVVALALSLAPTATGKGPPNYKDFRFSQEAYNASVAENSLASTLVVPALSLSFPAHDHTPRAQRKMGVGNPWGKSVSYSIISGDPHSMFKAESLQIGDFSFLLLWVRSNDRVLNREFKELYKLGLRAELLEDVALTPFDNSSQAKAVPFLGSEHTQEIQTFEEDQDLSTTTEKLFIISDELLTLKQDDHLHSLTDPFSLNLNLNVGVAEEENLIRPNKKSRRRTKNKRDQVLSEVFGLRRGKKSTSEFPRNSNGTRPNRPKGRGGGRRKGNRGKGGPSSAESGLNEVKVDEDREQFKSVTLRTTNSVVPNYYNNNNKRPTTTTMAPPTTKGVVLAVAETTVYLRVEDVDDNQPVFESSDYDIGVNEDAPVLSKVAKISAADADIGRNAEIYYSIVDWSDYWAIDPITGSLSPTRPLLGRTKDKGLRVRARNRWASASNALGSISTVNFHIKPVNRYAPSIRINRPPTVEVRPYGVIYAIVVVRDEDLEQNGVVDLSIVGGDPNGIFRIAPAPSRNEFYVEMSPIVASNMAAGDNSAFNLTLRATDRGLPPKSSEKELQIRVSDALWSSKVGPIFDKDVYEVEINESSPPHSVVFRLKRPDAAVGLSISSGNDGEDFILEEKSGVLYTSKWLDAESKSTYTLTLDSHDRRPNVAAGDFYRRRQSVAKIIIKVLDGNDNSPEWESLVGTTEGVYYVMENEAVGSKVARLFAKDRDSGENGYVTYSIANLRPTPFTIDHFNGELRLKRLLDYEIDRREYALQIRASDWGQPFRRESERSVLIRLKNDNDNRPLFLVKDCVAVLDRGIKFETEFGQLSAVDFDRSDLITYRIVGGNEDSCFAIDPMNGKLKVNCDLRDIVTSRRFLNVTATDGEYYSDVMSIKLELGDGRISVIKGNRTSSGNGPSGIKLFSTSSSVFECEDTGVQERFDRMAALSEKNNQGEASLPPLPQRYRDNGHSPIFVDLPREISVFENVSVGATVLRIKGRDIDRGYNGLLSFVISSGDEVHGAWDIVNSIPGTGKDEDVALLVVANLLDRETMSDYVLNISVYDQGTPPKSSSKSIRIIIRDSNDCAPTFTKSAMRVKVAEGGELVGESLLGVSAYDEDEAGSPNSQISYRLLTPSQDFGIDEKSGTITLLQELDRERTDFYELMVVAEDHGNPKLSSLLSVQIVVEDKNDCKPKLEHPASRMVKILEDWPIGGIVTQIVAKDEDLGLGGVVRYSIVGNEEDFSLDEISGVLRVKNKLDYETTSVYNITFKMRDLGTPSLSSESFIVVEVLDVLESIPSVSFSQLATAASLSESVPVGTKVVQVGLNPNDALDAGLVSLGLEGPSRYLFSINQRGELATAQPLDYETLASHWIAVVGKSVLTGKSLAKMFVFVNVSDTNECVPLTTEPSYKVNLPENTPGGVVFLKLSTFDCDPGHRTSFSLKSSTPYFEIDPSNGNLMTTDLELDREKQSVHTVEVVITDFGDPVLNSSSQVVIVLSDVNDMSPKFLHKRGIHNIPEFSTIQGDMPKKKEPEDNETEDDDDLSESEDSEDDETLKWSDWKLIEQQREMFGEGGGWKKIFHVVAYDNDEGPNGTVSYRLKYRVSASDDGKELQDDAYSINPTTGEIFTSAPFLKADTMLKFMIEASDSGSEPQTTETLLLLRVKAVGKVKSQPPQILLEGDSLITLTTKEQPGYTVETIDASDPDGESLWYEIVSGDPHGYFIMWPESQNLILAKRFTSPMDFKLNISVSDGTNVVFVQLYVKVLDTPQQSNSLLWSQPSYSSIISEQSTGNPIAAVKINASVSLLSGQSSTPKGTILYGFHNAEDPASLSIFILDAISGEVAVAKGATLSQSSHILTIKARDPSNTYGFVRLKIEVEGVNRPPAFYSPDGRTPRIEFRVPETLAIGSRIGQVEGFDMDEGDGGLLSYAITFGNIGNSFGIDRDSGWISLRRPLSSLEYQLTVQATDMGTPPLSASTSVTIFVTAPNDEDSLHLICRGDDETVYRDSGSSSSKRSRGKSSRGKTVTRVQIKENSQPGTYVTTIKTLNSHSASVSFELEDNRANIFWIDPSTGVVLVGKGARLLDRETKPSTEFTVKASNSRGARCELRVVIDLIDTDDHKPSFSPSYYEGLIREDALPGTLVRRKTDDNNDKRPLVLETVDPDVGLNSLITYAIIEEDEMRKVFHIDPSTGALLLVTSLDYEKRSNYVFHVKATSGGGLSSPNVATVNVTVENVNLKRPLVSNAKLELLLPTSPGMFVHRMDAKDPDGDELEYNITRGNEAAWFKLGKKSGELRVGKVEGLQASKIVLEVSVSDGRHWALATLNINVRNMERNPDFYFRNSTFNGNTMENSTKVLNLLSLQLVGGYINEPLAFELLSPTKYFGIKKTSGVIFTTGEKLDREEKAEHQLLVQVRGEESGRIARTNVLIKVLDKNDNCPVFLHLPYVAVVSLESRAGDSVLTVKSYDGDEGENAIVRYELVRSPHGDIYEIDRSSGEIRLRRKPDAVGQHELLIKAYDGGVPSCTVETPVTVKVVSSDQPVFERQYYETRIPEDAALGSTALALVAHAKNPILFSLAGSDQDQFAIDHQTDMGLNRICVLYVNSPLDFESQRTVRLTVTATDLLTSHSTSTLVLIHIQDSNDCAPQFEKPVYNVRLVEGYMPPKGLLLQTLAHDNDTGINAMLTYSLQPDDGPIQRQRSRRDTTDVMEDASSNQRSWELSRYFSVSPNNGRIILKQVVDYERVHEYRFSVVVKDSGAYAHSATARVVVQVVDTNDSGIIWEKNIYNARISESATRGQFVSKLSAFDPDSVDEVKYAIISPPHLAPFEIHPSSGVVRVSQPALLSTELSFSVNISATDGVFTSYAKLNVEVEPRNHFPPAFSSLIYEVGCPENAPDGHLITRMRATDPDRSIFGRLTYSIAQSDEPELFEIGPESGEVTLRSKADVSLDRELKGSHSLEILASDGGFWLGYTKLAIKVIDTNEYPPQFPVAEYRLTLPAERIKSKGPILQVVAVDADTEFGIRYSIVDLPSNRTFTSSPGNKRDSAYFEINPESGELRLRMSDQDVIKFLKDQNRVDLQFWVGATDEGGLHSYVTVTVVLLPPGVPSPEMSPQNATFFLKDDAQIGSIVTTFRVSNVVSPRFRVVSNNDDYFQVDNEGNLLVKGRLDQENEDKHTVVVWAESEDGSSHATSQVTIRVFQSAGRKRPPVLQALEFQVKVAEDFPEGSLLFTLRALDSDKGNNIKEKYSLSNGHEHFSINPEHGWITLVNKLDYETTKEHVLVVKVEDYYHPQFMTTATVSISVVNVPDCPVSFDAPHYFASVREDVPEGTIIATLHATDADLELTTSTPSIVSNYLDYFIMDGNDGGYFKINERGELSVWRGLDYEQEQKYELRILVSDGFSSDVVNASISVLDVNDNSPVCPLPEYEVELSESVPPSTYAITILAHDPDLNALAPRFSLAGEGSEDFVVHDGGVVTSKVKLDAETRQFYFLKVYAEDAESGEACSVNLKIKILDENDSPPKFAENYYSFMMKEDAKVGALVGKVHAEDGDMDIVNRRVRYVLVSVVSGGLGEIDGQFALDSKSGIISLLRPLDRELVPDYNLTIQANDGGIPTQSSLTYAVLNVVDINDNLPEFAFNHYSANISELAPVSSEVARVLAISKDIGENAEITYEILNNGHGHFGIHPKSGVVYINAPLDYERIREYVLVIRARTPLLASQTFLNCSIIDENDNAPTFSGSGYSVEIPEDATIGTSVIQLQAADLDSGNNSKISYQIGGGDRLKHFRIDGSSGVISVASALDREMIPHYALVVWAIDRGSPPLSSSVEVQVRILDVNDQAPILRIPGELIVQEDRPIGYSIHKFEVSDADASPNSEPFTWDLRDAEKPRGSSDVPFTISAAGSLNVAGKLNTQRKNLYKLSVRVFDNGDPPLYSDANVTVKLVEKSQWPPVLSSLTVTAITALSDSYPAGVPLGKVHASDFDPYDILVYSLVDTPSSAHFTIDASNGTLKSLTPLTGGTYELGITVSDGRWTARGDAYIRIVALSTLIPDLKLEADQIVMPGKSSNTIKKSRKDIAAFAVVMTLKGHNPQSLLGRIFGLINAIKESMSSGEIQSSNIGPSTYDVVILSVQSSKEESNSKRMKRADDEGEEAGGIPSVDILLSVRKSSDGSFVPPSELVKKLKFALPQIESVLSAKLTRLLYDICKEDSCERGQCRSVVTFEGTQSLISTETLSLITPNHLLETACYCPPGFGGSRCEKVVNACAHSECVAGFVCVPDASPKGYACLCRKSYCPPGIPHCEEDDHCAQQSVSFSGRSFLAYNVGPSLERELSLSVKIKTLYTAGTILHSFGHFDYALLEIRQGLVQFSWDLGTGKEVLTVTSVSVSDNRWHRITLHLRDNAAVLRVDERSTQRQRSPGTARSLHTGGILYIGAKIIGLHGSTLESLIPAQGFIGCMKDLRYGYAHHNSVTAGNELHIQEVKHYILTPGINRELESLDPNKGLELDDLDELEETYDHQNKDKSPGGRMAPLPLHSSDSDKLGSHLLWSRNISFSCERILHVVEACRSLPCSNGGLCTEDRSSTPAISGSGYRCDCPSRFHGLNCEIDLDPCGSQPCLNGGSCVATAPAGTSGSGVSFSPSLVTGGEWQEPQFFCQCPEGTFGNRCEKGRYCKHDNNHNQLHNLDGQHSLTSSSSSSDQICLHNGECEEGSAGPICWCQGGYTGATCQLDINECERGDACGPGSTCINFPGGFRCLCPANATGLRCNRILATPSIVVSGYQDLIIIVVIIVILFITFFLGFILIRRCCIARERNSPNTSIPLTAARGLKDNSKDNREREQPSNREVQQLLRNRDSKISNLEVRPVSANSDLFSTELEEAKPNFINNLMKGSVSMRDKGCSTHWDPNKDDYNKVQNYMKDDLNWVGRSASKPGSPTSDQTYHWDHSGDLTTNMQQPSNISPMGTLPPVPSDIPDSYIVNHSGGGLNNLDLPTINLAAFPPPQDSNPHEPLPLPYFDEGGTNLDAVSPLEARESSWPILHPNQYLIPLPHHSSGAEDGEGEDAALCSCPQLLQADPASGSTTAVNKAPSPAVAIRNRYKNKNSKPSVKFCEDEIGEDSSLLNSSSRTNNKSKIPRRHNQSPSNSSKTTHVTQV